MKYNSKDMKKMILLIAIAAVFLAGVLYFNQQKIEVIENGIIERPGDTQDSQMIDIDVYMENEKVPFQTKINLLPKEYTQDEAMQAFDEIYDKLPELIKGDNENLDNVSRKLNFINTLEGYLVNIEWFSSNYTLVDYDGSVHSELLENDVLQEVVLTVKMSSGEYLSENTIDVKIVKPNFDEIENQENQIAAMISKAEENNRTDEVVQLPDNCNGQNLSYAYHTEKTSPYIAIILGVLAVVMVIVGEKEKNAKAMAERTRELKYEYSEMVSKLTLLIGAGMTVRLAWKKIVEDYKKQPKIKKRIVYEEMIISQKQLENGISEGKVYAQFGKRCNTKEYLKLATLLEQNIRKGTKDLLRLLEKEAFDAFEEHKNIARKKGEEAGTKLLLPMVMMLLVVMGIVMAPAIMSFNM